jgi:hypothetical protein
LRDRALNYFLHKYNKFLDETDILGAGDIREGRVDDWTSMGFGVITPELLRPELLKLLGITEL